MAKYTDDEIRKMKKITCKIAADYLGVSTMAISWGMREEKLPIGFTVHNKGRYTDSYGCRKPQEMVEGRPHHNLWEKHK